MFFFSQGNAAAVYRWDEQP